MDAVDDALAAVDPRDELGLLIYYPEARDSQLVFLVAPTKALSMPHTRVAGIHFEMDKTTGSLAAPRLVNHEHDRQITDWAARWMPRVKAALGTL